MSLGQQRFKLKRRIGAGGMSTVYEAHDRIRDMPLALKQLRRIEPVRLYGFKREFRALSDLCHPNIITLYELVRDGERWYLAMELIHGTDMLTHVRGDDEFASTETRQATFAFATTDLALAHSATIHTSDAATSVGLNDAPVAPPETPSNPDESAEHTAVDVLTARQTRVSGTIRTDESRSSADTAVDIERLRAVLVQLADAVHTLHRAGLIHRDLKPSNVLVTDTGRVVVVDFGVVAELGLSGDPSGHAFDVVIGTPAFMAPEQVRGEAPSPATDWYAFGVIMYLCLTGTLPFGGTVVEILTHKDSREPPPPHTRFPEIPDDLDALCTALLARDPGARPTGAEVLARLHRPDLAVVPIAPVERVFVGRDAQRQQLTDLCAGLDSSASNIRLVLVQGPSGIGKTSLLRQQTAQLRSDERVLLLYGRCQERESLAYRAWDGVIDELTLFLSSTSRDADASATRSIQENIASLARLFPVLGTLLDASQQTAATPSGVLASGRDLRTRAGVALRQLLSTVSEHRPIVIVIDDLQWADLDSIALMRRVMDAPPQRVLVIAALHDSSRDHLSASALEQMIATFEQRELVHRMALEPLSEREQRQLVAKLCRQHDAPPLDIALLRQSGGHPLVLAELVRNAYEWSASHDIRNSDLDLQAVLAHRIAGLPESARALLNVIVVAGEPIPLSVAAVAAMLTPGERERALAIVRSAQLVYIAHRRLEPWLDSQHSAVRDALSRALTPERARSMHGRLARALELFAESVGRIAPTSLARHWRAAGDHKRAAGYLLDAAARAFSQLAFERSVTLHRDAIDMLDETDEIALCRAYLGLARGLRMGERRDTDLGAVLRRAHKLAATHGLEAEIGEILYLQGNHLFVSASADACLDAHVQAYDYARRLGLPVLEVRALSGQGDAHMLVEQWSLAREAYTQCVQRARALELKGIEAANLPMLGFLHWLYHQLPQGIDACERAIQLARESGAVRAEVLARANVLPSILLDMDRIDDARAELEASLPLASEYGLWGFWSHGMVLLGRCHARTGDVARALDAGEQALAMARKTRFALSGPICLGFLYRHSENRQRRSTLIKEAKQVLDGGTGSISILSFCADVIEAGIERRDDFLVSYYTQELEARNAHERMPWVEFTLARARAIAKYRREWPERTMDDDLRRLRDRALHVGRIYHARALSDALES